MRTSVVAALSILLATPALAQSTDAAQPSSPAPSLVYCEP